MLGLVVTPNGTMYKKYFSKPLCNSVGKVIDGYIERVRAVFLPRPFIIIVNEEGLLKKLQPNPVGCAWYSGMIVGNLVVMKDGYTDEGPDIVGLTDQELKKVIGIVSFMTRGDYRLIAEPEGEQK